MFGSILGAVAGNVVGGLLGNKGQKDANDASAASVQKQMDFQERMSNTSYQRGMEDMRKAGLNPMLAFMKGGASVPSGSVYQAQNEMAPLSASVKDLAPVVAQVENVRANTGLARSNSAKAEADAAKAAAETRRINAEIDAGIPVASADESRSRTAVNSVMYNQIGKNVIEKMPAEIDLTKAQTANVRAELPNIIKRLDVLESEITLNKSSANQRISSTKLMDAALPQSINMSEAQKSWWMRNISPYLPDLLKSAATVYPYTK